MLSPFHPLQLALGLVVWFTWFALMYGALATACAVAPPPADQGTLTWINVALLINTIVITGLLLYWASICWRAARAGNKRENTSYLFIAKLGASINLVGAVATFSLGGVVLLLPPCL